MGSDPAPFMASFSRYYHENKWLCNIKKIGLDRTKWLGKVFRFIDDLTAIFFLTAINDGGEFEA